MKEINLSELKQIEIGILNAFDEFCNSHSLSYSLSGGTLLGAVRHKGFIPWDDDIDVMMPREDYEKFIILADTFVKPYKVIGIHSEKNRKKPYIYTYTKIVDYRTLMIEDPNKLGYETAVYIDVFPIDGLSSDENNNIKRYELFRSIIHYGSILQSSYYLKGVKSKSTKKKVLYSIADIIRRLLPANYVYLKLDSLAKKYSFSNSTNIGCIVAGYGVKEVFPKNAFFPLCDIEFEGRTYKAINNPGIYLSNLYGDYMKLPPIEQRVCTHDNKSYWREM